MARKKGKRKVARKARKASRKATKKAARRTPKRAARKAKAAPKKSKAPTKTSTQQKIVGLVTHFYPRISVGIVEVKAPLKIGDAITFSGHGRSFKQKITSMQIEHEPITAAKKGDVIGMKVVKPVKEKDVVAK